MGASRCSLTPEVKLPQTPQKPSKVSLLWDMHITSQSGFQIHLLSSFAELVSSLVTADAFAFVSPEGNSLSLDPKLGSGYCCPALPQPHQLPSLPQKISLTES